MEPLFKDKKNEKKNLRILPTIAVINTDEKSVI